MNSLGIEFLSLEEVAEALKVTRKTIYNLIYSYKKGKSGISKDFYLKVGKKILFVKSKVEQGIMSGTLIS